MCLATHSALQSTCSYPYATPNAIMSLVLASPYMYGCVSKSQVLLYVWCVWCVSSRLCGVRLHDCVVCAFRLCGVRGVCLHDCVVCAFRLCIHIRHRARCVVCAMYVTEPGAISVWCVPSMNTVCTQTSTGGLRASFGFPSVRTTRSNPIGLFFFLPMPNTPCMCVREKERTTDARKILHNIL